MLIILPSLSIPISLIDQYVYPDDILYFVIIFDYMAVLFIVSFVYGFFPAVRFISIEKYFIKKGYEEIVIEYEFIKKILVIGLPILFGMQILFFYFYYNFLSYSFLVALQSFNIALLFGGIIRVLIYTIKRQFRFHFAQGCCKIITKREDELDKTKYLFLALDSYNRYLRRNTGFEIKDIGKIYSKFLSSPIKKKNEIIMSVCDSLSSGKIKLTEYLPNIYDIPDTELFVRRSILTILKSVGTFLLAAIPIILSLIQVFFGIGK